MKGIAIGIALAVAALCIGVQAADCQGRIDINGTKEGISIAKGEISSGGRINNASWFKDDQASKNAQYLCAYFPATTEWQKGSFSFTPDKDGKLDIQVKGAWDNDPAAQTWTFIDGIQAEGLELVNGNFEDGFTGWRVAEPKDGKGASVSDVAKSGSKSARVGHNYQATQEVKVKGGQPVTITFWYKAAQ